MQDGARCHNAVKGLQWLQDHQWPSNSPNLNPVENLWSILEEEMKSEKNQSQNIPQLKHEPGDPGDAVSSIPNRVKDVYNSRGIM